MWGSSFSAGHAYVVAAIDRRVKAVLGQMPFISGSRQFQALVEFNMAATHEAFSADRRARARGEAPAAIPLRAEDPSVLAGLPLPSAHEYFYGPGGAAECDPEWTNEITLRSVEHHPGYEPGWYLPRISPTSVLMVVAPYDGLTLGEWASRPTRRRCNPRSS